MSRRIHALNKTGIKSLQSGFFSEAICSFRMAMECLNANAQSASNDKTCVSEYVELLVTPVDVPCVDAASMLEASPHNTFDVYQTAFSFPQVSSMSPFQTETSVILFYNLALAHHLAGVSGAIEEPEMHLQQALKFYKIVTTLFKSEPCLHLDAGCSAIVLGTLTNMGHIFTHFWKRKDAETCRRHMQEILQSAAVVGLSEEDGEFFYSALTYSRSHDAVAAPAA